MLSHSRFLRLCEILFIYQIFILVCADLLFCIFAVRGFIDRLKAGISSLLCLLFLLFFHRAFKMNLTVLTQMELLDHLLKLFRLSGCKCACTCTFLSCGGIVLNYR